MKPFEKPVKQVEKPKDTPRKQPPKKVSVKAGSGGEGTRNSRRGSSDGRRPQTPIRRPKAIPAVAARGVLPSPTIPAKFSRASIDR